MERDSFDDNVAFRKLLTRTLILPLALLGLFVRRVRGQILYLKTLNRWVDHTDQSSPRRTSSRSVPGLRNRPYAVLHSPVTQIFLTHTLGLKPRLPQP